MELVSQLDKQATTRSKYDVLYVDMGRNSSHSFTRVGRV